MPSLTSKRLRRNLATGGTVCGLKGASVAAANNKSPLDDNVGARWRPQAQHVSAALLG